MAQIPELRKRIKELRDATGMSQEQFAATFGFSQSRVSGWELGDTEPSVEALLKLSKLAADMNDAESVLFFLGQSGLDPGVPVSIVDTLLLSGAPEAASLLPTAELILRERLGNAELLQAKGKVVLVPAFAEGVWRSQTSLPPLWVSAEKIPNPLSTYYVVAGEQPPSARDRGFAAGDTIFFDATGASARKFEPFHRQDVLLNFTKEEEPWKGFGWWPLGLYRGRLDVSGQHGGQFWWAVGPQDRPKGNWVPGHNILWLTAFTLVEPRLAALGISGKGRNVFESEEDAAATLTIPEGCEILGRVRAVFPA